MNSMLFIVGWFRCVYVLSVFWLL